MKGILLAGGLGTRLYPSTKAISKQILPIYDKPMIYYSLSVLMLAKIRQVLIISSPRDIGLFQELLGDGSKFGMELSYKVQEEPKGIGQAFLLGEDFIGEDKVALVLGDNIFWGQGFTKKLLKAKKLKKGARIFGFYVEDPRAYGVVELSEDGRGLSLEEKPENPRSSWAVPGLYFYDNTVIDKAKTLKPSSRGELEITDINKLYLEEDALKVSLLGRGMAWLDTGTHDSLLDASNLVAAVQKRGRLIACLEEIAYNNGWIGKEKLKEAGRSMENTHYGRYLLALAEK